MTQPLRTRLRDLSEQATPVDLTARVHHTARRLRRRRRAVAATAVVLAITAGLGVVKATMSADAPSGPAGPRGPLQLPGGTGVYVSESGEGLPSNSVLAYGATYNGKPDLLSTFTGTPNPPVLSPDGMRLAGVTKQGELVVNELDGRNRRTITDDAYYGGPGVCATVAWVTPRRLAYTTGSEIRMVNLDGTGGTRLSTMRTTCAPAVSPDGKTLVTVAPEPGNTSGGDRAFVTPVGGGKQQRLSMPANTRPLTVGRFSPDGRWIDVVIAVRGAKSGYLDTVVFDARTLQPTARPVTEPICGVSHPRTDRIALRLCPRTDGTPPTVVTLDARLTEIHRYTEAKNMFRMHFLGISPER